MHQQRISLSVCVCVCVHARLFAACVFCGRLACFRCPDSNSRIRIKSLLEMKSMLEYDMCACINRYTAHGRGTTHYTHLSINPHFSSTKALVNSIQLLTGKLCAPPCAHNFATFPQRKHPSQQDAHPHSEINDKFNWWKFCRAHKHARERSCALDARCQRYCVCT